MLTQQSSPTRMKARKATIYGGSPSAHEVIASSGITFQPWRLYQHAWLACLFFPLVSLMREPPTTGRLVLGLSALLFFAAGYTWLMWPHPVSQGMQDGIRAWRSFFLFITLFILALAFSLLYGPAWLWLFIGVSAIAGALLPMRSAFATIVLATLLPFIITIATHGGVMGVDWWWLIALMLLVRGLGLDMIGVARMGNAIRELYAARLELARLRVEEERLRMARDLHDLLGQTFSMITLKSELARHLIIENPSRCEQELFEMERVARQTLREVREAVAGYRQPCLTTELDVARQLLEAAGIAAEITSISENLPPAIDAALAWMIGEAVTNIVRHSQAQQCKITLTHAKRMVCAEVINDGGCKKQEEYEAGPPGMGLAGLRERVSVLGGHMEAGPLSPASEHFRISVTLPLQSQTSDQRLSEKPS